MRDAAGNVERAGASSSCPPGVSGFITFDLDSTLADTRWRHSLIKPDGATDWEAYAMACGADAPVRPVTVLWALLAPHHRVWVVSGRSEAAAGVTARWLARQGLEPEGVLLQPRERAHTKHPDWKVHAITTLRARLGVPHLLHIDDYPPVQQACQNVGIECLIVSSPQAIERYDEKEKGYV